MTSIAMKLGFEPAKLNWSAVATVKASPKAKDERDRRAYFQARRDALKPNRKRLGKTGLAKGLNARDHSEYVRQWRKARSQRSPSNELPPAKTTAS